MECGGIGMAAEMLVVGPIVTGSLGGIDRDGVFRRTVQSECELPIEDREAVARLERPLHLDLEWHLRSARPFDDPFECATHVESFDVHDTVVLAFDEPVSQIGVCEYGPDRGRDDRRLLAPEEDACATEGFGYCRGPVRDDRHSGGHRLEDRDAETFVLAHRNEDAGTCEGCSEVSVADLAQESHTVSDVPAIGHSTHRLDVGRVGNVPDECQTCVPVERLGVDRERLHQFVLTLVSDDRGLHRASPSTHGRRRLRIDRTR